MDDTGHPAGVGALIMITVIILACVAVGLACWAVGNVPHLPQFPPGW
jgi:hypothetical protein